MPSIGQVWSLSCEYAATSAATGLWGPTLSQQQMHAEIGNNLNPHKGFRGDIRGVWGGTDDYGVYPEAIVPVLHRHGYMQSRAFRAGTNTLKRELSAGHPVVVWIIGNYTTQKRVYLKDGADSYFVIPCEHSVTLYGYDERGVHLMDPAHADKSRILGPPRIRLGATRSHGARRREVRADRRDQPRPMRTRRRTWRVLR